ncbi:MAG: polysaccharide pyruvyl transferase family protein [Clostridia bacterium]|nr:polysaccharide pyruvyl transferase family protein [Clostridia bacterium]
MEKKKINIITLHRIVNYGSVLQAYATQKVFENKNLDVEFIDYYPERMHMLGMLKRIKNKSQKFKKNIILRNIARVIMIPSYIQRFHTFKKFINKNLNLSNVIYKNEDDLKNNPPIADYYCTGSDQVWNTGWNEKIDSPFFLDFDTNGKKCFSYAASFGKSKLENWEKDETKRLLKKYNKLSLREISGVEIVEDLGIKGAINVVDPTLLLTGKEWSELASERYKDKKFIFVYNLNRNKKIDKYVEKLAKEKNLEIYYVSYALHEFYKKGKMKCNVKVEDFLSLLKYAQYVVTDSFHATAFSINFNTEFMIVFPEKYSTRVRSILEITKLEDRIVDNYEDISLCNKRIDFSVANDILKEQRIIANKYIDSAL